VETVRAGLKIRGTILKDILDSFGLLHHAFRTTFFGAPKKTARPAYDSHIPLEENIRLQLEWVTGAPVALKTHGRDAFIFELRKPADRIARVSIHGDANAQVVMDKEKEFSDWVRQEFPDEMNRFALVEDSYKIILDDPKGRDVHEELKANKGNLTQNLDMLSGFSPKFMARAWLRILKPVVLVYGKRKLTHGDIKPDNILVDFTSEGDYAFRMADWGGHYDPANPRPPYEGTPMFQTKGTLLTGAVQPGDDVRALQLTFLTMYAGESLSRIAAAHPEAFEPVQRKGTDVPFLKHVPDELSNKIPASLRKILTAPYDNVSELQRALTEVHLSLEH
jgi:serine/threonine protein kinase